MFIRATHPHAFRSGEWAQLVAAVESPEIPGRTVWLVVFPDGATDEWPVDDEAHGYELTAAPPPVTDRTEDR